MSLPLEAFLAILGLVLSLSQLVISVFTWYEARCLRLTTSHGNLLSLNQLALWLHLADRLLDPAINPSDAEQRFNRVYTDLRFGYSKETRTVTTQSDTTQDIDIPSAHNPPAADNPAPLPSPVTHPSLPPVQLYQSRRSTFEGDITPVAPVVITPNIPSTTRSPLPSCAQAVRQTTGCGGEMLGREHNETRN